LIDDIKNVTSRKGKFKRFTLSWGFVDQDRQYVQTTRGCLAGYGPSGKFWLLPTIKAGAIMRIKPTSVSPAVYELVLKELESHNVFDGMEMESVYFVRTKAQKTDVPEEKQFLKLPSPYEARKKRIRCG
jgi:hypothetical protein